MAVFMPARASKAPYHRMRVKWSNTTEAFGFSQLWYYENRELGVLLSIGLFIHTVNMFDLN